MVSCIKRARREEGGMRSWEREDRSQEEGGRRKEEAARSEKSEVGRQKLGGRRGELEVTMGTEGSLAN
jgi:hypothetical protein